MKNRKAEAKSVAKYAAKSAGVRVLVKDMEKAWRVWRVKSGEAVNVYRDGVRVQYIVMNSGRQLFFRQEAIGYGAWREISEEEEREIVRAYGAVYLE